MKLKIEGTYKHRVRVNFLLFWYVEKWKTDKFSKVFDVPDAEKTFKVGPVDVTVGLKGDNVEASVSYLKVPLFRWDAEFPDVSQGFHAEPIKGCIIDATLSVE